MTNISVKAGERVAVVRRAFSSVPMEYRFSARAAVPGQALRGSVEVKKSRWIIPGSPETSPLLENNVVSAGIWNTFVSVDVIPDVEVIITTGRRMRGFRTIALLVLAIIVITAATAVMFLA
jgi:hypothetical protein